jgi:hypothetical protein
LVVTDDDISGTFTFLRALPDYNNSRDITVAQIGQSWLNYIIENRTILWWGGLGNSTEHTAYLRLKSGVKAPESGSMALNGKLVAEQIGAQIFIDGWDTDCNSGNLGCLVGIMKDSSRCITDAVIETDRVVEIGRVLADEPAPSPTGGAGFISSIQAACRDSTPGKRAPPSTTCPGTAKKVFAA